ncbi:hypothetical protein IAU60_002743 [Kwoniella sp. DSM 27419]
MSAPAQPFRTDSLRPSSLPSATLGRRRHQPSNTTRDPAGAETSLDGLSAEDRAQRILDAEHERWNERIDKELKGMIGGLKELVELADVGPSPSPLLASTLPLHLPLRTSSLIRCAQNIRDIAHELKLLLLLGDEQTTAARRDAEARAVQGDIRLKRGAIVEELGSLFGLERLASAKAAKAAQEETTTQAGQEQDNQSQKDVTERSTAGGEADRDPEILSGINQPESENPTTSSSNPNEPVERDTITLDQPPTADAEPGSSTDGAQPGLEGNMARQPQLIDEHSQEGEPAPVQENAQPAVTSTVDDIFESPMDGLGGKPQDVSLPPGTQSASSMTNPAEVQMQEPPSGLPAADDPEATHSEAMEVDEDEDDFEEVA